MFLMRAAAALSGPSSTGEPTAGTQPARWGPTTGRRRFSRTSLHARSLRAPKRARLHIAVEDDPATDVDETTEAVEGFCTEKE